MTHKLILRPLIAIVRFILDSLEKIAKGAVVAQEAPMADLVPGTAIKRKGGARGATLFRKYQNETIYPAKEFQAVAKMVERAWKKHAGGKAPTLTSMFDGHDAPRKRYSAHHLGKAWDFRTNNLQQAVDKKILAAIRKELGAFPDYYADIESPGKPYEHLHIGLRDSKKTKEDRAKLERLYQERRAATK